MAIRWREMSDETLEAHFNPRVASADAEGSLARYSARSTDARAALARMSHAEEDVRYGAAPKQTLDLYRPLGDGTGRPVVVFIHGGYWRALDKSDHSFVVPPLVDAGAVVANVNYDLCPDVTLDEMCRQVIAGVRFCHAHAAAWGGDPGRMVLIGHSAGAHLAARVLNRPADDQGRPADLVGGEHVGPDQMILREQARITAEVAERNDCLTLRPAGSARFAVCAGADEPEGWIDQSRRYADLVRAQGLECSFFEIAGSDHFTVLERALAADSSGWKAILGILGDR